MIKYLVLTQLVENTAGAPGLLAEHGASFHIEADGHHLLFDTGQGLAPNHCTGLDAVCYFKNRFPDVFHESGTGARHIFGST